MDSVEMARIFFEGRVFVTREEGPERHHQPVGRILEIATYAVRSTMVGLAAAATKKRQRERDAGGAGDAARPAAADEDALTSSDPDDPIDIATHPNMATRVARQTMARAARIPILHRAGRCTARGSAIMPPAVSADIDLLRTCKCC